MLQRCLDYATEKQARLVADRVASNALPLIQDAFGNYIVQVSNLRTVGCAAPAISRAQLLLNKNKPEVDLYSHLLCRAAVRTINYQYVLELAFEESSLAVVDQMVSALNIRHKSHFRVASAAGYSKMVPALLAPRK
eukprot:SAG31_NODE_3118_length_4656_cov_3.081413_3_plen_136_part_00